jgi:spermidine/putrescine ABC transporter ATP-binding subunit
VGARIQLIAINKSYRDKEVVRSVYLDVQPGEFLTILGPSGAGKTTVLKIVAGFEKADGGQVLIDGADISDAPPYKRNIGMLFQNYALFPHLTVAENIAFPLTVRKEGRAEIEAKTRAILERVKLLGYEKRLPRELSGGQQQRVALARALVFNPPILLLDEPMSALDKQLRKHMQVEVKEIVREIGITTISVTHDQEEALTMASQVCVMESGAVAQCADPRRIYERPRSVFIANFIGEANLLKGRIFEIEGDEADVELEAGPSVRVSCDMIFYSHEERVYVLARPEKIQVVEEPPAQGICLVGVIVQIIYVGEAVRLDIKIDTGETIKLKMLSKRSQEFALGQRVTAAVREDDLALVKLEDRA